MLSRRELVGGLLPVSAVALLTAGSRGEVAAFAAEANQSSGGELFASPPVVQHPRPGGCSVHVAVATLVTGWIEWGTQPDRLDQVAIAHHHGLIQASDRALAFPLRLPTSRPVGQTIYYRVALQPLTYKNAYQLERGTPEFTPVYKLRLPSPQAEQFSLAIVNDTHVNAVTLDRLHARIESLAPDVLAWNGDTCNDFNAKDDPLQIVLNPTGNRSRGWAAERPVLFVPGNHDVRGARARELTIGLGPWPQQAEHPYNFALRCGPCALLGLDTGEDKPDAHPVFAGTAAYEPYREQQAEWLREAVARPEIREAPFRIALCHIPLRGEPGDNDGLTLQGYARYSGMGARLWLPTLAAAGFHAIVSGHTHRHRIDAPSADEPITQIVGGGPQPERATLTSVQATPTTLRIELQDLSGQVLEQRSWQA